MLGESDLREVFGALRAEEVPCLRCTAADVVRAGGRVRRRRRVVAAAGSGVATAAVVVAVALLPGRSGGVSAPPETVGTSPAPATERHGPAAVATSPGA